jgi:hypothetical protein
MPHFIADSSSVCFCHLFSAERGDRVDKNVEREILNHRMLQNPNVVGFKEVSVAMQQPQVAAAADAKQQHVQQS